MILASRKLRVLWLIKGLGLGGAEKLLAGSLAHVDRDTFDYEVGYLLPWKDALVSEIKAHDIPVTCYNLRSLAGLSAYWRVWQHIARGRFDVIHAHLPLASLLARCCGRLRGTPAIVYTAHGLWSRQHPLTRLANRTTLRLNHRTIAVSDQVAASLPGLPPRLVSTIENGIDVEAIACQGDQRAAVRAEFGYSDSTPLIGNVANLSPIKRHDLLIRAFAGLHRQRSDARLIVVGQYRDRLEELTDLATQLGVGDAVRFTGPRDDVARILSALDVFCLSSDSEGLPVSLLEAMAARRAVVCTEVGGIPGVIEDQRDGLLVPADNVDALHAALTRLVDDGTLRDQLGRHAHQRVTRDFDISRMVRGVEAIYHSLLQPKLEVIDA